MFAGIIERIGTIVDIVDEGTNKHFTVQSDLTDLYIDQSIAHNGVCLTVVKINDDKSYVVTAIDETLKRSNLGGLQIGDHVNVERATTGDTRMDGHMVQGHVDTTVQCLGVEDEDGSWVYTFQVGADEAHLLVDKGSVAINGTSLTVINPSEDRFSVAIIPYTYEHTVFQYFKKGTIVNIEYDVIGKYIARYMKLYQK